MAGLVPGFVIKKKILKFVFRLGNMFDAALVLFIWEFVVVGSMDGGVGILGGLFGIEGPWHFGVVVACGDLRAASCSVILFTVGSYWRMDLKWLCASVIGPATGCERHSK